MLTAGTIPILVLAPFFLIWFGVGRISALLLVVFYVTVMLYVFAQKAASNLSPIYEDAARTLGATSRRHPARRAAARHAAGDPGRNPHRPRRGPGARRPSPSCSVRSPAWARSSRCSRAPPTCRASSPPWSTLGLAAIVCDGLAAWLVGRVRPPGPAWAVRPSLSEYIGAGMDDTIIAARDLTRQFRRADGQAVSALDQGHVRYSTRPVRLPARRHPAAARARCCRSSAGLLPPSGGKPAGRRPPGRWPRPRPRRGVSEGQRVSLDAGDRQR